ncbi:hypothetical protein D3C76_1418120 [compost metagenome]
MLEQRQRHHQRHDALAVLTDEVLHFLLVLGAEGFFQVTAQVMQHIGVGAAGGTFLQGGHQLAEVARPEFLRVGLAHVAQQIAEDFVLHRVVGHQQVFVA